MEGNLWRLWTRGLGPFRGWLGQRTGWRELGLLSLQGLIWIGANCNRGKRVS
jgi:hypothetical protein